MVGGEQIKVAVGCAEHLEADCPPRLYSMRLALARALFVKPDVSQRTLSTHIPLKLTLSSASHAGRAVQHVGLERHRLVGRLLAIMDRYDPRRVSTRVRIDSRWLFAACSSLPSRTVRSHDRAFLDAVATDIVHQHSQRLDYYKGNFTQFYATKTERAKNQRKEYESQLQYRQHLQAFIDRWRYNANRGG